MTGRICSARYLGKPLISLFVFKLSMKSWNFTNSGTSSLISVHVLSCLVKVSLDISPDQEETFAGLVYFAGLTVVGEVGEAVEAGGDFSIFWILSFKDATILSMFSMY